LFSWLFTTSAPPPPPPLQTRFAHLPLRRILLDVYFGG
jgi:hypothetical protein